MVKTFVAGQRRLKDLGPAERLALARTPAGLAGLTSIMLASAFVGALFALRQHLPIDVPAVFALAASAAAGVSVSSQRRSVAHAETLSAHA